MTAATVHDDLVIVSDLHLGGYPSEMQEAYQSAFAAFLTEQQRSQARRGRAWRLVLLGDVIDFAALEPPVRPGNEQAVLERTGRALHAARICAPDALQAVRDLVDSGITVEIVAGNHDGELVHPVVQQQLAGVLGSRPDGVLRFHRWALHIPGLVYAEHGSQHHDINRIPDMGNQVSAVAAGWPLSPGGVLSAHRHRDSPRPSAAGGMSLVAQVSRALVRGWASEAKTRRDGNPAFAADLGGNEQLGTELWNVSSCDPVSMAGRLARRSLARRRGRGSAQDYMISAARRVHGLLKSHQTAVAFYVFGHTHEAAIVPLDSGPPSATYVNTGTWSPLGRGRDVNTGARPEATFVLVDGEQHQVTLGRWNV